MTYAPLTVFVYNRPVHTEQVLSALNDNTLAKETDLIIFADGARDDKALEGVNAVRKVIREFKGNSNFRSVRLEEADHNIGCRDSIIGGVTKVLNEYGKTIIVEDDLITRKNFLQYMNDGLDLYEHDERIWSLGGHTRQFPELAQCKYDFYLTYRACSWGWAIWKDRWDRIDWEVSDYEAFQNSPAMKKRFARGGKDLFAMLENEMNGQSSAWDLRLQYSMAKTDMFTVYPKRSFVFNIGLDGSGTHCVVSGNDQFENLEAIPYTLVKDLPFDPAVNRGFLGAYYPNTLQRGIRKLKRMLGR